jgi:hypothetical protein
MVSSHAAAGRYCGAKLRRSFVKTSKAEVCMISRETRVNVVEVFARCCTPCCAKILIIVRVGTTGRCNTVGFGCCPDRRCMSGETESSWRVVGGGQKKELWERWRAGESISDIARALQKAPALSTG